VLKAREDRAAAKSVVARSDSDEATPNQQKEIASTQRAGLAMTPNGLSSGFATTLPGRIRRFLNRCL